MKIMEIIVPMFYSPHIVSNSNLDDIGLKYNNICHMTIFYFKDMFKKKMSNITSTFKLTDQFMNLKVFFFFYSFFDNDHSITSIMLMVWPLIKYTVVEVSGGHIVQQ